MFADKKVTYVICGYSAPGSNLEWLVSVITDHDISPATLGALPVLRRRFPGRFNDFDWREDIPEKRDG